MYTYVCVYINQVRSRSTVHLISGLVCSRRRGEYEGASKYMGPETRLAWLLDATRDTAGGGGSFEASREAPGRCQGRCREESGCQR